MYKLFCFLIAVIPSGLLVCYFYRLDKQKPGPKGFIVKIFLLGVLSVIPAFLLGLLPALFVKLFLRSPILIYLVRAFIIGGLCEEFIKLMVVKKYAYNDVHFSKVMDGILYTVVASWGLGCLENTLYIWLSTTSQTMLFRAIWVVPMHVGCSGLMGYYIGKAKFAKTEKEEKTLMYKGLGIAALLHGLYDFCVYISPILGLDYSFLAIPIVILVLLMLKRMTKMAIAEDSAKYLH